MKKRVIIAALFISANIIEPALAANCTAPLGALTSGPSGGTLTTALVGTGLVACYPTAAPFQNQETLSGSTITDYKKGPGDKADPPTSVGSYSIGGSGHSSEIGYKYGAGSFSYFYVVKTSGTLGSGATYEFYGPVASGSGTCPDYGAVKVEVSTSGCS